MRSPRVSPPGILTGIALFVAASSPMKAAPVDFSREIQPILSENCFHCHGPDAKGRKADLRLDTPEGAFGKNSDGIAAIVPGHPELSSVIERIHSKDKDEVMPPPKANRTVNAKQSELLKRWIEEGAKWGTHWAFSPIQKPEIPAGEATHPIDFLVREKLGEKGLQLQPQAPRRTLLRRLSLDLTGLPPTAEEIANFDADTSEDAIERTVDRLLASPRYGERMAWDWLDAARYADTNGYQGDNERTMWPWRDWVISAFNRNLPYDKFTQFQLAGDLLPGATQEQKLATGFLRNHPINGEGGRIAEENRVDYVMDMAETTGTVWLGLTFHCCRCHDHKYDPLSQADYYRFYGFFNQTPVTGGGGDPKTAPRLDMAQPSESARLEKAKAESKHRETALSTLWQATAERRTEWAASGKPSLPSTPSKEAEPSPQTTETPEVKPNELEAALSLPETKWTKEQRALVEKAWGKEDAAFEKARKAKESSRRELDAATSAITRVMIMGDTETPRPTFILNRGLYNEPGEQVSSGVPKSLQGEPGAVFTNRLDLVRWMNSDANPLMARVTVNRIWQGFFGVGLVKTAEDFGVQAETPIHRDLLDWLAAEFRESGWDLKGLIRRIVTSATYLQSSSVSPELARNDPENRLLARGARFRIPSWMIRDQALAASELLSRRMGGRPVNPMQPAGVWEEATFGKTLYKQGTGEDLHRRSLYTFWRRIVGPTMFFDSSNRTTCSIKPLRTNTPLHALATLNDPTYVEAARALAQRILSTGGASFESRLRLAYELLLTREPSKQETTLWAQAITRHLSSFRGDQKSTSGILSIGELPRSTAIEEPEIAAYTALCLSLLNLDETLTKE